MTALTNAERQRLWRKKHPQLNSERNRAYVAAHYKRKPRGTTRRFIALDGEGAGTDSAGRQNYLLLRAGDATGHFARSVKAQGTRLSTAEALDFILELPKDAILVGFFFGYDVTMILRDLPPDRVEDLFMPKYRPDEIVDFVPEEYRGPRYGIRKNPYTYWQGYGIEYVPKQYLRVCRIDRQTLKTIKGTTRTVNEVGGFFQMSFVQALKAWEIGDQKMLDMIAAQKDRREQFETIGAVEDDYCRAECKMLAQLMEKFRGVCTEANIIPRHWRGAGHIAARLHELNKTPVRKKRQRWKIIDKLAEDAYYGGRFEITTIGRVTGDVWEYDIRSAYPAAMLQLPCPVHGRWKRLRSTDLDEPGSIYIADLSFRHPDRQFLCGFPIREKGRLYFPKMGSGVYWSPEIEAAKNAGAAIRINGGYRYVKRCECDPFRWVADMYEYRRKIIDEAERTGGSKLKGNPIKLGINGLYGKFAQRVGAAPWRDYVMAGLITAFTRAKIINAYAQAPLDILYIATDALYSRKRLQLDIGECLGQWEEHRRDGIFIVQPGIYWSGDKAPKTRGIPRSIIIENRERFEAAWNEWIERGADGDPPVIPVFVNQFVGMRAAMARGKRELAGTWLSDIRGERIGIRDIDFDWKHKRKPHGDFINGDCMVTQPFNGGPGLRSESYDGEAITEFNQQIIEREDDPDFYPWGNSGE